MNEEEADKLVRMGLKMAALVGGTCARADDKLVAANAKIAALLIQRDAAQVSEVSNACFKSAVAERDDARNSLAEARASLVVMSDKVKRMRRSHEGALTERNEVRNEIERQQTIIVDARLASGAEMGETLVDAVKRLAAQCKEGLNEKARLQSIISAAMRTVCAANSETLVEAIAGLIIERERERNAMRDDDNQKLQAAMRSR